VQLTLIDGQAKHSDGVTVYYYITSETNCPTNRFQLIASNSTVVKCDHEDVTSTLDRDQQIASFSGYLT
jgi:hypothetical protein